MIIILLLISLFLVFYDLKYYKVPNLINLALLILVISNKVYIKDHPFDYIIPGLIAFITLLLVYMVSKGKLGMGDIKYSSIMAIYFGYRFWLGSLIYASIVALLVSIILLLSKKIKKDSRIPFIPFLVIGNIVNYLIPIIK